MSSWIMVPIWLQLDRRETFWLPFWRPMDVMQLWKKKPYLKTNDVVAKADMIV